jgi:integrase
MMAHPARTITAFGKTQTLRAWAAELRLSEQTIRSRLDVLGWDAERALSTPADRRFRKGGRPRTDAPRHCPKLREDNKGAAFVRWRAFGRDYYRALGQWGHPDTLAAYRTFCAEWSAGAFDAAGVDEAGGLGIGELVCRWIEHVDREYRKLGKRTSEYHICRAAAATLNDLYGAESVAEFTPAKFRTVRDTWVKAGKTRSTCNSYSQRVARLLTWGLSHGLVPAGVVAAVDAVEGLKRGRTAAPDEPRTEAVPDATIDATLDVLPATPHGRVIGAMVRVQRLAGLRPQHLTSMRLADLDRSGAAWVYVPPAEGTKTHHIGKAPVFYFGPKAQEVLAPLVDGKGESDAVFSYLLGKRERVVRVTVDSYAQAVRLAAKLAGVPHWHPHQLRHSAATAVAVATGSVADAAAYIGDELATARRVYAHYDPEAVRRRELALRFG